MVTDDEEAYILSKTCVPEYVLSHMVLVSKTEPRSGGMQ
jgi:hypothetical protein